MARPQKAGIDYFPLDVAMDDNVAIIEATYGITGFGIVIKLYQKIYSEGYFYKWTEKEQLLFSNSISVDKNTVTSIVSDCLKWGLFDKDLYESYNILTSKGIQKRYVSAIYKRAEIEMDAKYLLINVSDKRNIAVIGVSDDGNSSTTIVSDGESTQSILEKSKEKNISDDEPNIWTTFFQCFGKHPTPLQIDEINSLLDKHGIEPALISHGFEKTARTGANFNYAATVFINWIDKGILTLDQAIEDQNRYLEQKKKSKQQNYKKQKIPDYIANQDKKFSGLKEIDPTKKAKIDQLLGELGET